MKPLQDYIVLEKVIEPKATNIVLTGQEDIAETPIGLVTQVNDYSKLHVGEKVLYKIHLFDEIEIEGKKVLIGKEEGVIALL